MEISRRFFATKVAPEKQLEFMTHLFRAVRRGISFNSFQREMMRLGLSYRRKEMLEDWRWGQAVGKARTPERRDIADRWFNRVFEPYRKKYKLTSKQASERIKAIRKKVEEAERLTPSEAEYWESYEGIV